MTALQSSIKKYFAQTDEYYDELRDKLLQSLTSSPVQLPVGQTITHFVFVTDRHCNIGMDRLVVALAQHFDILNRPGVSGGPVCWLSRLV